MVVAVDLVPPTSCGLGRLNQVSSSKSRLLFVYISVC